MYFLVCGFFPADLRLFLHVAVLPSALLLDSIPFCVSDMMYLSILLLIDIWVISTSGLQSGS